ncbi:MAG: methylornithine synthase PylB [Deltaproteobacteria bacterium]|nr:methylornithine synthase PylB [Deltaproteobacteria bacterium]
MLLTKKNDSLENILSRALDGRELSKEDLIFLLSLDDERDMALLFEAARQQRQRYFGHQIFLYGFVYFTTYCRNDCVFCHYRNSNTQLPRYRKDPKEILAAVDVLAKAGVHLIDLTMGEDPVFYKNDGEKFQEIASLIRHIKATTGLAVMVSPGAAPEHVLRDLATSGADWYACYQETHNRCLFDSLRTGQEYHERLDKKIQARRHGMLIEEGILSGAGDSLEDLADSILKMKELDVDQARIMTFVPQKGTPLADLTPPDAMRELLTIALLRLVLPDRLIPASLDVDGLAGLKKRLHAGANVVTSIVVPGQGFAGVANVHLDIEESRRTPQAVRAVLEECHLQPAVLKDYLDWINQRRTAHGWKGQDNYAGAGL